MVFYDLDGNPIDEKEWTSLASEHKTIDKTFVEVDGERVTISTVWLGLDRNFGRGLPLIFETMIFGLPGGEEPIWRYSTRAEAMTGHRRAVNCLRDPLGRFTLSQSED